MNIQENFSGKNSKQQLASMQRHSSEASKNMDMADIVKSPQS